jgi:hypothetical protein
MEDLPISRFDQISIANDPAAMAPNHGLSMFPADEKRSKRRLHKRTTSAVAADGD